MYTLCSSLEWRRHTEFICGAPGDLLRISLCHRLGEWQLNWIAVEQVDEIFTEVYFFLPYTRKQHQRARKEMLGKTSSLSIVGYVWAEGDCSLVRGISITAWSGESPVWGWFSLNNPSYYFLPSLRYYKKIITKDLRVSIMNDSVSQLIIKRIFLWNLFYSCTTYHPQNSGQWRSLGAALPAADWDRHTQARRLTLSLYDCRPKATAQFLGAGQRPFHWL